MEYEKEDSVFFLTSMGENSMRTIGKDDYLEAAQIFNWATKEHYILWFTGRLDRHRRTEVILPRLVKKGKLKSYRYGKRFIYIAPRMGRNNRVYYNIEHGLACTEGLVRIWRSKMDGIIIVERHFRGLGSVPEWGIRFPNKKLLLYEHCTENNFTHAGMIKGKVTKYLENLPDIESKYQGEGIVLFVLDVDRKRVESFVSRNKPIGEPFFFTDYQTFIKVPIGKQLSTTIYIWGVDGDTYPLTDHD